VKGLIKGAIHTRAEEAMMPTGKAQTRGKSF